jgi:hypothetical protein
VNPLASAVFVLLGFIFLTLASMYLTTPAGALAPILPGYALGVSSIRFDLGIGTGIVCLFFFALAWLLRAPLQTAKEGR